jgi:hypothetical protein
MTSIDRLIHGVAKVPWRRSGCVAATALALGHYEPAMPWSALARLFCAMSMLVVLPYVSQLLDAHARACRRTGTPAFPAQDKVQSDG